MLQNFRCCGISYHRGRCECACSCYSVLQGLWGVAPRGYRPAARGSICAVFQEQNGKGCTSGSIPWRGNRTSTKSVGLIHKFKKKTKSKQTPEHTHTHGNIKVFLKDSGSLLWTDFFFLCNRLIAVVASSKQERKQRPGKRLLWWKNVACGSLQWQLLGCARVYLGDYCLHRWGAAVWFGLVFLLKPEGMLEHAQTF